jgi:hypothetical protein
MGCTARRSVSKQSPLTGFLASQLGLKTIERILKAKIGIRQNTLAAGIAKNRFVTHVLT